MEKHKSTMQLPLCKVAVDECGKDEQCLKSAQLTYKKDSKLV